jgi:hypothetical protein
MGAVDYDRARDNQVVCEKPEVDKVQKNEVGDRDLSHAALEKHNYLPLKELDGAFPRGVDIPDEEDVHSSVGEIHIHMVEEAVKFHV